MLKRRIIVPLMGLVVLAGCGDDAMPTTPGVATRISISPESHTFTALGETRRFSATVSDQYGETLPGTITWSSSAPQFFTVDANGTATAVANGSGTLTASYQNLSASASVTVDAVTVGANRPPTPLGTVGDVVLAAGGGPIPFQPTGLFEDPDDDVLDLTYTAMLNDPGIASANVLVDSERHVVIFVTGTAPGSTTLTITATDPGGLSADQSVNLTVDDSGFTPSTGIRVENNRIVIAGLLTAVGQCSRPLRDQPQAGYTFTITSSKWQTRSNAAAPWTDVAGTETTTGQLCPYTSDVPGEYRLVFDLLQVVDERLEPVTGSYRSENSFVVAGDSLGRNQTPVTADAAPTEILLSTEGGPVIRAPQMFFSDPDGDSLKFLADVSDPALFSAEVLVDSAGYVFVVAQGRGAGSGTLTITATDPGGLSADLVLMVTVEDSGYTRTTVGTVSNGALHVIGATYTACIPAVNNTPGLRGIRYTVHWSKWQRRSEASAAWTDVEGTELTDGRLCPYSTEIAGDYRMVANVTQVLDEQLPAFRGSYVSGNFFTVSGGE